MVTSKPHRIGPAGVVFQRALDITRLLWEVDVVYLQQNPALSSVPGRTKSVDDIWALA